MIRKPLLISLSAFVLFLGYFYFSYDFHPGLSTSFQGQLPRDLRGQISWDYGNGFLEKNSIEVLLSASKTKDGQNSLGKVVVEPSGTKNDASTGYMTWLIITELKFNNPDFIIEGRHHWGHWMKMKKNQRGRQLALYPGTKIVFENSSAEFTVKFFNTPQSGIAKVSSEFGEIQYYDGYGRNRRWGISEFDYHKSFPGSISFLKDPYRNRFLAALPLPHHKIYGLKFSLFPAYLISDIKPIGKLTIRSVGETFPLVFKNLLINGQPVDPSGEQTVQYKGLLKDGEFHFLSKEDFFELNAPIVSYAFDVHAEQGDEFLVVTDDTENEKQKRQVRKNGMLRFSAQARVSKMSFDLQSIEVNDIDGQSHIIKSVVTPNGDYLFENIDIVKQDKFSPILFYTQLFTAAILALLLHCFLSLSLFSETKQLKHLPRALLVSKGRWLFWLVLASGIASNMLWLLAEWPGSLTPDTIHIHSEVKRLLLTNHHPYIYSLFVLGLYNVYDAPLTIVLFQLITFYAVIAWWLYFLFRNGVRWYLILPLYFLTFLSAPVNLFNITVWKDIPYNTLVLYWAFFLTAGYYLKRQGRTFELTISHLILLSLAFLFLCTFRHNGLIYLPVIPVFLLFFTKINRKWIVGFLTLSGLLLFFNYQILPGYILQDKPEKNDFAKEIVSRNVKQATQVSGDDQEYYLEHYLSYRVKRFVATLGASPKASTWYNDMHAPPQRWFSVDEMSAESIVNPKSNFLVKYKNRALKSRAFKGFTEGRFLHWNSGFGLLALAAAFMLYKWVPLSAFYSSFFLIQAAGMFFVVWPRWRYLYFLYLGGMYLVFTLLLELTLRKERVDTPDDW